MRRPVADGVPTELTLWHRGRHRQTGNDTFTTALDQSTNTTARNTVFEEIPPTKCRFVRLTMTDWPRTTPLGIIEFTVFGRATESLPAAQPIPRAR